MHPDDADGDRPEQIDIEELRQEIGVRTKIRPFEVKAHAAKRQVQQEEIDYHVNRLQVTGIAYTHSLRQ